MKVLVSVVGLFIVCSGSAFAVQQMLTLQVGQSGSVSCVNGTLQTNQINPSQANHLCVALPHPNRWHEPGLGGHEHHDPPPVWLENFSLATFGHGIIYGGDETTSPMENGMKHAGFKGVTLKSAADGEQHCRGHFTSNPMDRSSQYHSYECGYLSSVGVRALAGDSAALAICNNGNTYLRDCISFYQGWYDTGDPNSPNHRISHSTPDPGTRPIIISPDEASWANNKKCEQWYPRTNEGGRGLDFAFSICQATTFYHGPQENATAHDMSTWFLTGGLGNIRGGGTTDIIFYDRISNLAPGMHCATFRGATGPCGDAYPMKWYVSPTMAADLRPSGFGFSWIKAILENSKTYTCNPQCVVPN